MTRDAPSSLFFHQMVIVFHIFVCDSNCLVQVGAIGSGRTTVSLMKDEFSSFNMLTGMIGASVFAVAWEVWWSAFGMWISDTR
jgi:hypothetical protein